MRTVRAPRRRACSGGANDGKRCTQASDCPSGMCVAGDDDHTLAGPAAIAISRPGDALPCSLATGSCSTEPGVVACVDDFFANDGACGTTVPLGAFQHFTALPPPNSYQNDCFTESPPCNPTAPNLHFGVDTAGNLLLPVSWQGVLVANRCRCRASCVPAFSRRCRFRSRTPCSSAPTPPRAASCRPSSSRRSIPACRIPTSCRSSGRSIRRTRSCASGGASGPVRAAPTTPRPADGRFVAFATDATNLLGPGADTNGATDVFVRDRQSGTTERISVGPGGLQANATSNEPSISPDGRFVAFQAFATNLLGPGGDTNGVEDVFVHDRQLGITERVSVGPGGLEADGGSFEPVISADGRFVAFTSNATNLLGPGGDTNGFDDVFVHDRGQGRGGARGLRPAVNH